jgi:cation diffusion facilitator CzcD-associated flavoprotein CzcO
VLHSSQYKSAKNYIGKKVVVVGTGASGHDISADCVEYGVGESPPLIFFNLDPNVTF